jgi:hypothetical protein
MNSKFSKMFFSGEIATLNFKISSLNPDSNAELYDFFQKQNDYLKSKVEEIVESESGGHIQIERFSINEGSVNITIILEAIGVLYYGISRYKNFVESIHLIYRQLKKLFDAVTTTFSDPVNISGSWQPSDDFVIELESSVIEKTDKIQLSLIGYLILSHLVLLCIVVYLALHR